MCSGQDWNLVDASCSYICSTLLLLSLGADTTEELLQPGQLYADNRFCTFNSFCLSLEIANGFSMQDIFTGNSYFFGSFIDNSWLHKLQYFCKKFDLHKDSKKTDRQGDQQTMTGLRGCHKKMENFVRLLFLILSQTCLILMKKIDKILCQCFI